MAVRPLPPRAARVAGHGGRRRRATVGRMTTTGTMPLGNFSVSLAVKDLAASRAFYEKLGFVVCAGDPAQNWLILQNGSATVGLFQGMFERNMLTFNPGWDSAGNRLPEFTDLRE